MAAQVFWAHGGGIVFGIVLAKATSLIGIPVPPSPNASQGYIPASSFSTWHRYA
jgi:hypothetical protein